MENNKFEKDSLDQINKLDESVFEIRKIIN